MQQAVLAILSGNEQSTRCADALKSAGFSTDEISILMPDPFGAEELGFVRRTRILEGIVVGVIAGALFGAGFGLVASHMQPPSYPFSQFVACGEMVAALAMSAVFAAVSGLVGGIVGFTISEYAVCKFDRKTKIGNSLMAIHADNLNQVRIVKQILRKEGAQEIRTVDEERERHKTVQIAAH